MSNIVKERCQHQHGQIKAVQILRHAVLFQHVIQDHGYVDRMVERVVGIVVVLSLNVDEQVEKVGCGGAECLAYADALENASHEAVDFAARLAMQRVVQGVLIGAVCYLEHHLYNRRKP